MTDAWTDTTSYTDFVQTGYDRFIRHEFRSNPVYDQLVDVHPVNVTNPGETVTLTITKEFTNLSTTPLTEHVDPDSVAQPAPTQVSVTVDGYGMYNKHTIKLDATTFTPIRADIARAVGLNMVDTVDALAQAKADTATNVIGLNGGTMATNDSGTAFDADSVVATDKITDDVISAAVALLAARKVPTRAGNMYVGTIHPFIARDVMKNTGWLNPHQYVDSQAIYANEIGMYLGVRWLVSPRATSTANTQATPVDVYNTHIFGAQALVKANNITPHTVIGNQIDPLKRYFPIGWYGLFGDAVFRQDSMQLIQTASGMAGLS